MPRSGRCESAPFSVRWRRYSLLFALVACGCAHAQAPEDALHRFYAWVLAHPSRGLPSPSARAELANVLSRELVESLAAASAMQAKCVDAAPAGDKPLIVEGDLFVGNYEGATEVVYGRQNRSGDTVMVESDLLYVDNRFPKAHEHRAVHWKDRVELRFVDGRWIVADVHFQRNRTLLSNLEDYVAEGMRSCGKTGQSR